MTPAQALRSNPGVIAGILAATGLAWWWTVERMAGMDAAPGGDLGTLGWFTGSWVVMMAAMMLPSFAPTLAAYGTLGRTRAPTRLLLFASGYLLAWTAAGVVAYGVYELGKGLLAGDLAWHGGVGQWLSGGLLVLAAAYQFAPLKQACLTRCRGQLGEPRRLEAHGRSSALAMGARSGGWCIGCSWALMAALFALGAMSLTWMVLIAMLVALEKTGPWPLAARLAAAVVLAALAVGIVTAPQHVPGLVVPSSGAMHAMKAMG
jgi:predicted metal-binding membrane protein